jgi:hypothetical protein
VRSKDEQFLEEENFVLKKRECKKKEEEWIP